MQVLWKKQNRMNCLFGRRPHGLQPRYQRTMMKNLYVLWIVCFIYGRVICTINLDGKIIRGFQLPIICSFYFNFKSAFIFSQLIISKKKNGFNNCVYDCLCDCLSLMYFMMMVLNFC